MAIRRWLLLIIVLLAGATAASSADAALRDRGSLVSSSSGSLRLPASTAANLWSDSSAGPLSSDVGPPAITNTKVFAVVLVYNSSGSANSGLGDAKTGLSDALEKERPGLTLQGLNAKVNEQLAFDAAYFAWADVPGPERVYMFLLRKQNVVGLIATAGPLNALGGEQVRGFVTKMFGQMPAPVNP